MARQFEKYRMRDGASILNESFFNPIFNDLDLRLHQQELIEKDWQGQIRELNRLGLRRIDENLAPALEELEEIIELGFLTATLQDNASITFNLGQEVFFLKEGAERDQFRPAPFIAIQAGDDPELYAIGRTLSYNRETGALLLDVVSRSSALEAAPGPHADVHLSVLPGGYNAIQLLLQEAQGHRDATEAARDVATGARDITTAARDVTTAARDQVIPAKDLTLAARDVAVEKAGEAADSAAQAAASSGVPSVTGQAGKYLKTDGEGTAWEDVPQQEITYGAAVQAVKTDTASTTSASYVDTGLEVTITLEKADSKVLLSAMLNIGTDSTTRQGFFVFVRDGTILAQGDADGDRTRVHFGVTVASAAYIVPAAAEILDEPGSIGPHTYKIQWARNISTLFLNRNGANNNNENDIRSISTLTAREIVQ